MKARTNRWHPVMLPDDYIRKMKQVLEEVEAQVEAETRYEPDPESYNVDTFDVDRLPDDQDSNPDADDDNQSADLTPSPAGLSCPR